MNKKEKHHLIFSICFGSQSCTAARVPQETVSARKIKRKEVYYAGHQESTCVGGKNRLGRGRIQAVIQSQ